MTSLVLPDSLSCALSMSSSMPSKPAATPTSEAAGRSALLGGGCLSSTYGKALGELRPFATAACVGRCNARPAKACS